MLRPDGRVASLWTLLMAFTDSTYTAFLVCPYASTSRPSMPAHACLLHSQCADVSMMLSLLTAALL